MTTKPSIFRQAYDVVALVAILNVLAFAGLAGLLASSGALSGDKLHRIVGVIRETEDADEEPVAPGEAEVAEEKPEPVTNAQTQMSSEIMRLEGERIKQELDQRLALNNSILLRVMTERERFEKERKDQDAKQNEVSSRRQAEGFKKQIDIYEALSPKVALQHLLDMPEPDEAAKILLELTTRKAKKIVETAKSGQQLAKMKTILQRVRLVAPDRSADLKPSGS